LDGSRFELPAQISFSSCTWPVDTADLERQPPLFKEVEETDRNYRRNGNHGGVRRPADIPGMRPLLECPRVAFTLGIGASGHRQPTIDAQGLARDVTRIA
jgi:hypothetical protein